MRKILMIILCFLTVHISGFSATASGNPSYFYDNQWHPYNEHPITLKINGDTVQTEIPPIIINDRTLVPVRSIFEKIGASVSWDGAKRKVKVVYDSTTIELTIDNDIALINGKSTKMDLPAKIINDSRTMIPLRFVAEKLGMQVEWNEKSRLVSISKPSKVISEQSNSNIFGIDISNWQGDINFPEVKSSGVKVVYIKATEGVTYTDPNLKTNYEGASKSGLKVGFYHFLRANDPIEEAKNFLNQTKDFKADCKYMIDVESAYGQTPEQISSNVRKFADYLISQGKDVGVYTYLNFYKNYLNDSVRELPLWLAQYDVLEPELDCIGWQASSKGSIKGINANVDIDYFGNGIFAGSSGNMRRITTVKETGTKTVNVTDKLNVRSSPSTSGEILGTLSNGEKVKYTSYVLSPNNEVWYSISFNGCQAYIIADYLKG